MLWSLRKGIYRTKQYLFRLVVHRLRLKEPTVMAGHEGIEKLCMHIANIGIDRVLIVTDEVLLRLGLLDELERFLDLSNIEYIIYSGVRPNPTIKNIEEAKDMYTSNQCHGIIAFGGGSSMDCAKIAAARIASPKKSVRSMKGLFKVRGRVPKLYAIPTTAGTGSETTLCAVVSDPDTHEKFAITDNKLVPDIAVLDPTVTLGLPKHITATTGMDALTHAIEAYIGIYGTPYTNEKAEEAVKLVFDNLQNVYRDGSDIDARMKMLYASFYGGIAFTRTYVGYVHAIAHNLGGLYGVPHGLANAVVLPYILEYYGDAIYPRLSNLARIVGLGEAGHDDETLALLFIGRIKDMNREMHIPTFIEALEEKDIDLLARRALKEGNPEYPVPVIMNYQECRDILYKLLKK